MKLCPIGNSMKLSQNDELTIGNNMQQAVIKRAWTIDNSMKLSQNDEMTIGNIMQQTVIERARTIGNNMLFAAIINRLPVVE